MGICNRLVVAALGLAVATAGASLARGADSPKRVQPVPLGGYLSAQTGDQHYGVYVPTRFGGQLTIKATDGQVTDLTGPDGRPRQNGGETGMNAHGWYTFKVTKAEKPYSVATTFVQVGQSARKPWNFYYWPTKSDAIHEPWAGGNGRVDDAPGGGRRDGRHSRSYIAPARTSSAPGPNGILETPCARGRRPDLVPQPL
ncbi:MAG: hypothetical protein U0835_07375 [Isosphaeraceae bacterium]